MAHNIEQRDGAASMAFTGDAPWHKLGEAMPTGAGVMEFYKQSRLNYEVKSVPIFSQPHPDFPHYKAEGFRGLFRTDTNTTLGVVTEKYRPVQNSELAALAEVFHKDGRVSVETSGVLGRGERVWMLLRWCNPMPVPGEEIRPYLLLSNGHDGKHAVEAKQTTVRVVCQNTLDMALGSKAQFKFTHIGDMEAKLKSVAAALGAAEANIATFSQLVNRFNGQNILAYQATEFWEQLVPGTSTRAKNIRGEMAEAFETAPGHVGNVWGLVNAVSFYTDHLMGTRGKTGTQRDNNRLASVWYGSGAKLKAAAVAQAKQLVGV